MGKSSDDLHIELEEANLRIKLLQDKIERMQDGLDMAMHFLDSPESFSNEEFQAVANRVYAADGQDVAYTGKVPYLDKYCDLLETINRVNAEVLKALSKEIHG